LYLGKYKQKMIPREGRNGIGFHTLYSVRVIRATNIRFYQRLHQHTENGREGEEGELNENIRKLNASKDDSSSSVILKEVD